MEYQGERTTLYCSVTRKDVNVEYSSGMKQGDFLLTCTGIEEGACEACLVIQLYNITPEREKLHGRQLVH